MNDITCNHCGKSFEAQQHYCPYCLTPTPARQNANFAASKRKILLIFIALVIFCAIMILWLPRN